MPIKSKLLQKAKEDAAIAIAEDCGTTTSVAEAAPLEEKVEHVEPKCVAPVSCPIKISPAKPVVEVKTQTERYCAVVFSLEISNLKEHGEIKLSWC